MKEVPPIRLFASGELFYSGEYDSDTGKVTTTYHNRELQEKLEPRWSERLTEAARTSITNYIPVCMSQDKHRNYRKELNLWQ